MQTFTFRLKKFQLSTGKSAIASCNVSANEIDGKLVKNEKKAYFQSRLSVSKVPNKKIRRKQNLGFQYEAITIDLTQIKEMEIGQTSMAR